MSKLLYQKESLTLTNGQRFPIQIDARYFTILSNTGSDIKVTINDQRETELPKNIVVALPTIGESGEGFTKVEFYNDTGATVTVEYAYGNAIIFDNRTSIVGTITTDDTPNQITSPAKVTVATGGTQVVASDTERKYCIIQNHGSEAIWWGKSAATIDPANKRGNKIDPDAQMVVEGTFEIYAKSVSTNVDISVVTAERT